MSLPDGTKQGCVNEGADYRILGWLFCPIQRWLSIKTTREPWRLIFLFGRLTFGLYLPPFVFITYERRDGQWLNVRAGYRWDGNWPGYIFPEAAIKVLDHPISY